MEAAQELVSLMEDYEDVEAKVERIREYEHVGDTITHQIMEALHRTFVTPLDREDIALIGERLDDVMDFMDEAALSMRTYKVERPTAAARQMASIILRATQEVEAAIAVLAEHRNLRDILKHSVEINRLENEGDLVFRNALGELFAESGEISGFVEIIKWREIYDSLEQAIDRCEDVANVLEGVVLKNA